VPVRKTNLDYRTFILREFEKRKAKNARYSLRAFARYLGTSTSRLSEILNGKTGLSPEKAATYADKIGLSDFERELFLNLVEARHARSEMARNMAQKKVQETVRNYTPLDMDSFELIADWHHFAILEYFQLSYATAEPATIAEFFDVTAEQVQLALERLCRLELLQLKDGHYQPAHRWQKTSTDVPSRAIRQMHRELLVKAATALATQPVEQRDFKASIFAFDKADVPFVKKKLDDFQEELAGQLDMSPKKDSVYCLLFNLFELSKTTTVGKYEEIS
jgi:uncharacterized protein (TIGR02147 family)